MGVLRAQSNRHNITARRETSSAPCHVRYFPPGLSMIILPCAAPKGQLDPAPITSLPLASIVGNSQVTAFWGADDSYYLRSSTQGEPDGTSQWYRTESGSDDVVRETPERLAVAKLMENITAIGGGRIAFPFGSSGRRVYRVWRTGSQESGGRTKIREVRAARSRRLPA